MLLKIKNLKLKTIIGIYPWEEKIDREIVINIEIDTDFNQSLKSDDINDTIDYDFISSAVKNSPRKKRRNTQKLLLALIRRLGLSMKSRLKNSMAMSSEPFLRACWMAFNFCSGVGKLNGQ